MGETRDNDAYEEELLDYEEEEEKAPDSVTAKVNGEAAKKGYVGIHSSGFRDFLLKPELLRAIVDSGFEHPSEVQHECIPQAILGMDVICQAKSGMGKTAVFVLSSLQQIEPSPGQVIALVLCHTRELAYQICHEFERFSTYLPDIKVAVFYGGVNIKVHKDLLKNECPHIVVGTPGRILALARDKDLSLKNVRHFILDECDKMLESLDMRRDVQEIFKMTPHDKQVMMFSATLSKEIRPVCKKFMQDPMEIYVDDEAKLTLHGLVQHYIKLSELEKNRKLNDLLDALDFNQVVIFVKSVNRAAELNKLLVECNFPSICIHSGMSQEERLTRYKGFKEGHKRILVATDLVGRGIDIERVNIVINYDMPDSADTYLHRVGRAGRFGTKGLAITFVSSASDSDVLNQVQERFEVDIKELPEQIDTSTYSKKESKLMKPSSENGWGMGRESKNQNLRTSIFLLLYRESYFIMASITLEELHTYHAIDREVFSRLVIALRRDPAESLLVMAIWLWLEEKGYPKIIANMVNLSDPLLETLAGEGVSCLNCLGSKNPTIPPKGVLPLTPRIMEKDISLQMFYQNKFSTISEIKKILHTVCSRIFTDILQHVLGSTSRLIPNQPLIIPGFPNSLFGSVTIVPRAMDHDFPIGGLWGWHLSNNVSEDDRTLFPTFSRGFPVSEDEIRELFTKICGVCVDSVRMQENVACDEQPLFARMVLHSVTNVDQILTVRRRAKFRINGKHIWARKYERRE
ncbi:hypothetical protein REPUB_Repub18cG0159100 [Reevesia pubescens]